MDFVEWKRLNTVFRSIDGYALNGGFTLSGKSGAEPVTGTRVSAGFFRTLGVVPASTLDGLELEQPATELVRALRHALDQAETATSLPLPLR